MKTLVFPCVASQRSNTIRPERRTLAAAEDAAEGDDEAAVLLALVPTGVPLVVPGPLQAARSTQLTARAPPVRNRDGLPPVETADANVMTLLQVLLARRVSAIVGAQPREHNAQLDDG